MTPPTESSTAPLNHRTSDHLANERTFLAWIRTSTAVMGLGFVVARFNVWLREIASHMDHASLPRHLGLSMPLGVVLMAFGGGLSVIALTRYRAVKRAIEQNRPSAAEGTTVAVSVIMVCLAVALTIYMLVS